MPTLIANEVTLAQLRDRFGIMRSQSLDFFPEASAPYSELSETEQTALGRVQENYLSQLAAQSLNEETVKMVVVSPLLDIAGFYRYPFTIDSEVGVEIQETDESGTVLVGRIDTLIARNQLWILVVEAKRTRFSVQVAIPQALSYLLTKPHPEQPGYALITNGGEFVFVKFQRETAPIYDLSDTFSLLNRGNDLTKVLNILKRIAAAI
jgi:predicted type IV restriction endonuclease